MQQMWRREYFSLQLNRAPEPEEIPQTKKNVRWNNVVTVALIPRREEFREANLFNHIWWSDEDFADFKWCAFQEINRVCILKKITPRECVDLLYQPH